MDDLIPKIKHIYDKSVIKIDGTDKYEINLLELAKIIPLIDLVQYTRKNNVFVSKLISKSNMIKMRGVRNFASHPFGFDTKVFDVNYAIKNIENIEYPNYYVYNKKRYSIEEITNDFNTAIKEVLE